MTSDQSASPNPLGENHVAGVSRRSFLRRAASVGVGVGTAGLIGPGVAGALDDGAGKKIVVPKLERPAESSVRLLYESLSDEQRKIICRPFDDPLRSVVKNNWHIVPQETASIGKLYSSDQQELIRQILRGVTSEDGYERFQRQMRDDAGGIDNYVCAIFGKPGQEREGKSGEKRAAPFEWVMTGRHLTIRADGDSVAGAALGGPIFYGHAVTGTERPDHPGNVWWHQARLANQVYESLDGKQQEKALLSVAPSDSSSTVVLPGRKAKIEGIAGSDLSRDQQGLLQKTLESMLSMYRKRDVDEVLACISENGGIDRLHMSFYQDGDLGDDGIWDRWQVKGPGFVWYFRGSPHVHTWLNVAHPRKPGTKAPRPPVGGEPARRRRL